jgi:RecB family exonuclease
MMAMARETPLPDSTPSGAPRHLAQALRARGAAVPRLRARRDGDIAARHAETKGEWVFPALDGFTLVGKADRLDLRRDGTLEIIDFKTGGVPQPKDMRRSTRRSCCSKRRWRRPAAFPRGSPPRRSALTYIKIGLGPEAFQLAAVQAARRHRA